VASKPRWWDRLLGRGPKGWSQPPFWASPELTYAVPWTPPDRESIGNDPVGYINGAYKADGIVFACQVALQLVFSEITFGWRKTVDGRPQDIYSTAGLELLETAYPGGLGELLSRMEATAGVAGNWYATRCDDAGRFGRAASGAGVRVVVMRPDWVSIVLGSRSNEPHALDSRIVAYMYEPRTAAGVKLPAVVLLPEEVAHYAPLPDPEARYRGMSWMTPVVREIEADKAATGHKLRFFQNGATLSTIVKFDKDVSPENFDAFVARFRAQHEGADNAYKTLFVGGGADPTVVGADLRQLDFKSTQGAGETRIAAAARVHPVILGLSEGMQGSSLNAGNYTAAKRNFVDGTMRPKWRVGAHCLERLLAPPQVGDRLTYDDRDIAFLRDDRSDVADIQNKQAWTIRALTDAGFTAESVVGAVVAEDWRLLDHSGLFSVQLQPPTTEVPAALEQDGDTAPVPPPPADDITPPPAPAADA